MSKPIDCPRFQNCNAPVCPLDPTSTVMLGGEPTCHYLRACVKTGADVQFSGDPVYMACKARLPELVELYPVIGRAAERAAKSPLKTVNPSRRSVLQGSATGVTVPA